jgi:hypothetical protein
MVFCMRGRMVYAISMRIFSQKWPEMRMDIA